MGAPETAEADPFDLPDWLGLDEVTWRTTSSLGSSRTSGVLEGAGGGSLDCDLLACDLAYPAPVLEEKWRAAAHQAWAIGELLLVRYAGRLTLVVPGTTLSAEPALEAVRRLAKAVGAPAERFAVRLRL